MADELFPAREFVGRLNSNDADAVEVINRFSRRLIGLARNQLDSGLRQKVGAEDVVQSVFRTFFRRHMDNEFDLRNWENLWSLLALITLRKCTNLKIYYNRRNRDRNLEVSVDAAGSNSSDSWQIVSNEPTPAHAAILAELVERALTGLPAGDQQIIGLTLEGKDIRDISEQINRSERFVYRSLQYFRERLEKALEDPCGLS